MSGVCQHSESLCWRFFPAESSTLPSVRGSFANGVVGELRFQWLLTHCVRPTGAHRQLGTHVCKVRSTTLDVQAWDGPTIAMFEALGNAATNAAFEARIHDARGAAARDDIFFSHTFSQVCAVCGMQLRRCTAGW